ncbi:MAG: thermonuclease family protein [Bdellovibrionota bacterium]
MTKQILVLAAALLLTAQAEAKIDKCNKDTKIDSHAVIAGSVDGDTVHITVSAGTFSVRFIGIDTPETHFMGKSQGLWGETAAREMARMLPVGQEVTLEFGTQQCDFHGRVLADVWVGKLHANAEMVKKGLAVNYCVAPEFKYCDEFARDTQNAIDQQLGMFSDKNVELPYDFRRRIENQTQRSFVGNIQTKEVHSPGHQNDVPVADRVFFFTPDLISAPYKLVN